mmetsp:Transcript_43648/g.126009  ORF Transcript_43648/g.126009 Transcript_43648/m.126009 type:complete len:257 (-) Transcript_43648:968-1738(-)
MATSRALMSSVSLVDLASKSDLWSCVLAVVISFSWISDLQKSVFFTSSSCCTLSMATILSMAFLTTEKASSSTDVAKNARFGLLAFRAVLRSSAAASCRRLRARRPSPEALCSRLYVPFVASRASSSVRISMVSDTALISSSRALFRASNFLPESAHVSSKFFRNFWDSANAAFSCDKSSFPSANAFADVASSSSAVSEAFSPPLISSALAERSSEKDAARPCSRFCDSDRPASISSFICLRIPNISPLCELYAGV